MTDEAFRAPRPLSRRGWLAGAAVSALAGGMSGAHALAAALSAARPLALERGAVRLAAAWDDAVGHRVGVLGRDGGAADSLSTLASLEVPTRAHGLLVEAGGQSLLAVARRPGDWLLRWQPAAKASGKGAEQWRWSEPGRSFNGHVAAGPVRAGAGAHPVLFTTETDLDSGLGLIGVRDAHTLEKRAEWPTHGMDPHEMLLDARGLWVANGGIPTQPETGRAKVELHRMDPSLVRLDPRTGRLLGQWRLPDPRLSVRHLALDSAGRIGIALQAEHDAPDIRAASPVLAVFDGATLQAVPLPEGVSLLGYGGDIAALPGGGFAVSSPKAGRAARWRADAGWLAGLELPQVCALAESPGDAALWCAGEGQALRLPAAQASASSAAWGLAADVRVDNHWVWMPRV